MKKNTTKKLIDEGGYDSANSNERTYLDLRASTQEAEKLKRNDSKINL